MAITNGNAYVNTVQGTDDTSHGGSAGTGACATLRYLLYNVIGTLDGALTINCVGGTESLGASINLGTFTSGNYKVTIKGDRWAGSPTDGTFNTSKYNLKSALDETLLSCPVVNLELDGLQIEMAQTSGSSDYAILLNSAGATQTITIKNCLVRFTGTTSLSSIRGIYQDTYAGSTITIINSSVYNFSGTNNMFGIQDNQTGSTTYLYNCTLYNNYQAARLGTLAVVKNCLFISNADDQEGAWAAGSDYNTTTINAAFDPAGSDNHTNVPATGANGVNVQSLTAGSEDFRLTSSTGDPNVRNSGTDIAAATPDPMGVTRPDGAYDRGMFEYSSGSSASASPSASPSGSPSASPSGSPSASPSASVSPSPSASPSASPSEAAIEGSVCWGHNTDGAITQTNKLTFNTYWTGTGTILNPGNNTNEAIELDAGEYMISDTVTTGAGNWYINQNFYISAGTTDVDLYYRTSSDYSYTGDPNHASWTAIAKTIGFVSLGYVQVKIQAPS